MNFRALIAVGACLAGAGLLGWKSLTQTLPKPADLVQIEGTVERIETATPKSSRNSGKRRSRRSSANYPVIHLKGMEEEFKYLDWFPDPARIYRVLPGDQVRLLTDPQGERWVWSLSNGGREIVTYAEVAAVVRSNRQAEPYIATGLGLIGLFGLFRMIRAKRR